jgi:hypothetical protein
VQEYKQYSIRDDSSRAASPLSEDGSSPSATKSLQETIAQVPDPSGIDLSTLKSRAYKSNDEAL